MRNRRVLLATIVTLILSTSASSRIGESDQDKQGMFKESDSESLWRGWYAHCDYGFYVVLPDEFVAHSELPPNPNHGFLVGLPDPATTQPVSAEDQRFIYVTAEYNSSEAQTLGDVVDYLIDLTGRGKHRFKVIERQPLKFHDLRAIQSRVEYAAPPDTVVEEEIAVLRAGIIYEIGLRTTKASYGVDKGPFERIKAGFRFWRIHYC